MARRQVYSMGTRRRSSSSSHRVWEARGLSSSRARMPFDTLLRASLLETWPWFRMQGRLAALRCEWKCAHSSSGLAECRAVCRLLSE